MKIEDILQPFVPEPVEEKKKRKSFLFDLLNDLYHKKKYILNDETITDYKPFLINRWISGNLDTVLYAQEMNQRHQLEPNQQYDYYFYSLPSRKRYSAWAKAEKDDKISLLMEYYNYSRQRAKEVLKLHTEEDYEKIKRSLDKGGVS